MKDTPSAINEIEVGQLARHYYGINGVLTKLPGEVDFNFLLDTDGGNKYVLKVSRPGSRVEEIEFQCAIVRHLVGGRIPLNLPSLVTSLDGREWIELEEGRYVRMHTWVSGHTLGELSPRTPELLESWGNAVGLLSKHLLNFQHQVAHRFYKWNPSEVLDAKKYRTQISEESLRVLADYFWDLFETQALPILPLLRKSVNYNDAHEQNLLVDTDILSSKVTGVIDFGDAVYTETINELAIACAYACMDCADPLKAATHVIRGYHAQFPIEEKELSVLFPLIAARLIISVVYAAWNRKKEPENAYLQVSEKQAWQLLKKLRKISPRFAHYTFRGACNLEPCPIYKEFKYWLKNYASDFHPVIDFKNKEIVPIDLSVGSTELGNNSNFEDITNFARTVQRLLEDQNADLGVGGYAEARPFYTTRDFEKIGNSGVQWRTVHLGVDFWSNKITDVFAPLEGTVHSFNDNEGSCNYGPTLILQHQAGDFIFYTLYGHLSRGSLSSLVAGKRFLKGDRIASLGLPEENGNWPVHLHFQIILDLLDYDGDFPGVAYPHETATWLSICPDVTNMFADLPQPQQELTTPDILKARKNRLGKSLSISYAQPLHIVRGYKQHLYDQEGRRYLDTVNNVAHVGHQHPRVVKVASRQLALLNTNTRYLHDDIVLYAGELLSTLPKELSIVHFVNSGSEANELALRMVEAYSGQQEMIAVEVGYHGNTKGCIGVSSYKFDGSGGKGAPAHTHIVPIPDTYRGLYRNPDDAGSKYASHIEESIKAIQAAGKNVGGFICESILSCGGQIVLPCNYLQKAYASVRAAGGLCIADEVQVGFGRVGEEFWGFQLQGVIPDIVTLGKPMGNGHPLAAVVTTEKIAEAFANGMEYFNTFGGNPVSCAIGREVLKIIQEEGLQSHAKALGDYLLAALRDLQTNYAIIGDIRGHGLFLGIELVRNRESLEPAEKEAAYLVNRMRERGVLMSTDGPYSNVLKIKPPMCLNKEDVDFLLENLELVLRESILRS